MRYKGNMFFILHGQSPSRTNINARVHDEKMMIMTVIHLFDQMSINDVSTRASLDQDVSNYNGTAAVQGKAVAKEQAFEEEQHELDQFVLPTKRHHACKRLAVPKYVRKKVQPKRKVAYQFYCEIKRFEDDNGSCKHDRHRIKIVFGILDDSGD